VPVLNYPLNVLLRITQSRCT